MALYEDVIKYLNEKNKGGGTSGGMFDNYDESNNPFIMDFDKDKETDAIPFNNPIVEAARRDNDRSGNDPYNMNSMNNPNVRTKRDYFDPRSSMTEKTQKQGFSVSGLLKGLLSSAIPGMGMMNMAKGVAGLLPANKRALMENELLGKGYSLNSLGQIVTDNYNSKEGIMAGLNANRLNEASFDKKSARIEKTLADKYGMSVSDIAAAKAGTYSGNVKTDLIDRLGFVADARKDILGSVTTSEELEQEINDFKKNQSFLQKLGIAPGIKSSFFETGKKAADTERARVAEVERVAELQRRQEAADKARRERDAGNIGGGGYRSDRDNDGDGGYGGSSKRSEDNRSSDLGFSDIRLKDNIELVGKSPSNINIYNFTYLNNPKVYQGVMAHEVPWASVKHKNGYLMVDYNKVDVQFKKI
jgi:hypothetical protein